ncbi:Aldo/keto reductase [Calocera viscosa TUFC12733]|uniref:Aldo/keto reductase n=1 Tax=Calocera viscosa (strain TUFC12733) TaxID=1330018 RepID=A0A167N3P5_CALVF|nr:Aldo/keto reductase [Calocera viscosa TUFC12733]
MANVPNVMLNTDAVMPAIGLGTSVGNEPHEWPQCKPWIHSALQAGYRHLDTAYGYNTEQYVGEVVRESGIPRDELWITTKLPPHHMTRVAASLEESLNRSGFDYFDLYLMHWPITRRYDPKLVSPFLPQKDWNLLERPTFSEVWAEMEKLVETGKVKNIGVSNFSVKNLEILLKTAKIVPAVNQVELHPVLAQNDLLAYCKEKGIILTAYSPTGYAEVRENPEVKKIAKKHGVSSPPVTLAWHVQRGTSAVPKSANAERQKENLNLPKLDEEDMKILNSLDQGKRLCDYPGDDGTILGWTLEQLGW